MDMLTHGLVGAATAQLGFRSRIGRDAAWVAAAAAVLPDLDTEVVRLLRWLGADLGGQYATMIHHRGISHSLLMVPVLAAGVAGVWWWARRAWARRGGGDAPAEATAPASDGDRRRGRPPPFLLLWGCCLVAVLNQPVLDTFTSYGTQILTPLTHARFAVNALPIVDMFFTPLVALTLLACWIARRLRPGSRRLALAIAWTGMGLAAGYAAAGATISWSLSRSAVRVLGTNRAEAYPLLATIFGWRITAQDDRAWYVARHNVLFSGPLEASRFRRVEKVDNDFVRRARRLRDVELYDWFALGQLRASCERVDGKEVVAFHDMRYAMPADSTESLWPLRVTFGADGRVLDVSRGMRLRQFSFGDLVRRVWRESFGP